jgi:hypothetical protein
LNPGPPEDKAGVVTIQPQQCCMLMEVLNCFISEAEQLVSVLGILNTYELKQIILRSINQERIILFLSTLMLWNKNSYQETCFFGEYLEINRMK